MKKVVFLYTELAGYFLSCLEALSDTGVEIHVFHLPVNREAPFRISGIRGVHLVQRKNLNRESLHEKVNAIAPDLMLCSGWVDKDYLSVCLAWRRRIPVVLLMDNQWRGSLKQMLAATFGKILFHGYFTHVWVPGEPQKQFAVRLGFKGEYLHTGFYCADNRLFSAWQSEFEAEKKTEMPHRLLYVGRYVKHKGIFDLWQAFEQLAPQFPDWELWCAGTGDCWEQRARHPRIKHFGFVQPADLGPLIRQTSVFVLPSHFEPWGVVLHEMSAAGMPLVCSGAVGAASAFVSQGKNGLLFAAGNCKQLENALKQVMSCSNEQLNDMGAHSMQLAAHINQQTWTATVHKLMQSTP